MLKANIWTNDTNELIFEMYMVGRMYVFDWEVNLFDLAQEPRGSKLDKGKEKSDRRAVVIVRQLPR